MRRAPTKVLLGLALAFALLPFLPGVALANWADVSASLGCDGVVQFTATAWAGSPDDPSTPQDEAGISRTNPSVDVWYTLDGGPANLVANGSFDTSNGFAFSGQFDAPVQGSLRVFAQARASWGDGRDPGGARSVQVARPTGCGPPDSTQVSVCHATNSVANPYVLLADASAGDAHGHLDHAGPVPANTAELAQLKDDHARWGDVIPPFTYQGQEYSLNWDAGGQALLRNACSVPTVQATPNVEITKRASQHSLQSGESFDYTLRVTSTGDATAEDVVVTDSVPAGLTITNVTGPACSTNGQDVICGLGDLDPGASATITITVTATVAACPSADNTATVTWTGGSAQASDSVTVDCDPSLTITKSASLATTAPGVAFTYTITVQNANPHGTAEQVVVTDSVPAGLTITNVTGPGCSTNGQDVACAIGSLGPNASATVTISVTATEDACPSSSNRAHVAWVHNQTAKSLDSNTVVVDVECAPNVTFSKSGPATVVQGGTVTYTIDVENTGNGPSDPITVTDGVPSALSNVQASATQGTCSVNGNDVTCSIGVLAAGSGATVTITGTAPTGSCPSFDNVAHVQQGTQPAQDTNSVTTTVTGCGPDVHISKSASAISVPAGGQFSYSITVTNSGTSAAQVVRVQDDIPAGLTITNVTGPGCTVNGQTVRCDLGDLDPGASITITITVTATPDACPSVTNKARVTWRDGDTRQVADSNQVTVGVECATNNPGVSLTKSASASSVDPGGSFTYTVTATSTGNATAQNVVITDTVPAGLTITNVTGPGCSTNGQTVTCDVGDLAPGASVSISITVTATASACPSVVNTAHVAWQNGQATGSADSNQVTVAVNCAPGVQITKGASAVTVQPGDSFTYTVTVTNTGSAAAGNVVVTDQVPTGLTITNVSGPGCSTNGQTVTCNVGTVNAGASVMITITVTATESACPGVQNQAHVTFDAGAAGGGSVDSNVVSVGVSCEPHLRIVKRADAPRQGVDSGDSFTYTITVTNDGNAVAHGVVVTDEIPGGLRIDLVIGPSCAVANHTVTCDVGDLAAGASVTITIDVTATAGSCPAVENTAHVEWTDGQATVTADSVTVGTDVECVGGKTVTPTTPPPGGTETPPGGIAFTGADDGTVRLGMLAVGLLVLGTGLLFAGYRRRTRGEAHEG